ncbi:MAG: NADH-quinone oxidoreductase subunit C [Planctomycetia bacterium]
MDYAAVVDEKLGANVCTTSQFRDNVRLHVPAEHVFAALGHLKSLGFDMLIDLTAVDYLYYPEAADRFGVIYSLVSTVTGERLYVKTALNEPVLHLKSAFGLWPAANWLEREVYDMYGIIFDDHPDFRRLLLPDEFTAFPLRKDYPTQGRGERHNFPVVTRAQS